MGRYIHEHLSSLGIQRMAERIVINYLRKHGKKPEKITGNKNFGDLRVGKKIIEVKGDSEFYEKDSRIRDYIELSVKEKKFLEKNPNLFEVYCVFGLAWETPRIVEVSGKEILKIKPKIRQWKYDTKKEFWKNKKHIIWKMPKLLK